MNVEYEEFEGIEDIEKKRLMIRTWIRDRKI